MSAAVYSAILQRAKFTPFVHILFRTQYISLTYLGVELARCFGHLEAAKVSAHHVLHDVAGVGEVSVVAEPWLLVGREIFHDHVQEVDRVLLVRGAR